MNNRQRILYIDTDIPNGTRVYQCDITILRWCKCEGRKKYFSTVFSKKKQKKFSAVFEKNGGEKNLNYFFLPFTLAPSYYTHHDTIKKTSHIVTKESKTYM